MAHSEIDKIAREASDLELVEVTITKESMDALRADIRKGVTIATIAGDVCVNPVVIALLAEYGMVVCSRLESRHLCKAFDVKLITADSVARVPACQVCGNYMASTIGNRYFISENGIACVACGYDPITVPKIGTVRVWLARESRPRDGVFFKSRKVVK